MMPFTDNDLKRLKEAMTHAGDFVHDPESGEGNAMIAVLGPILARLEAAEELADARGSLLACTQEDFDTSDGDGYAIQGLVKEKEEALRKAAGKGE